jgi:hypothetical protein
MVKNIVTMHSAIRAEVNANPAGRFNGPTSFVDLALES